VAQSEFPLPDVGEGLTEAEIVAWKVKPGDAVTVNQVLVEIETAKSLVELPSPFAGTVTALLADEGSTVEVGTPIIRVDSAGGSIELQAPGDADTTGEVGRTTNTAERAELDAAPASSAVAAPADVGSGAVLVGYGAKGGVATTRRPGGAAPWPRTGRRTPRRRRRPSRRRRARHPCPPRRRRR
jgi:pyruvate dehydrogenase E2 component (dihydrolipoamide acetyltransferase)